jgi:hypothetical protein
MGVVYRAEDNSLHAVEIYTVLGNTEGSSSLLSCGGSDRYLIITDRSLPVGCRIRRSWITADHWPRRHSQLRGGVSGLPQAVGEWSFIRETESA